MCSILNYNKQTLTRWAAKIMDQISWKGGGEREQETRSENDSRRRSRDIFAVRAGRWLIAGGKIRQRAGEEAHIS